MSDPWRNREELHQSRNLSDIVLVEIMKSISNSPQNPQHCEISRISHLNISRCEDSPSYCFRVFHQLAPESGWREQGGLSSSNPQWTVHLFQNKLAIPLGCKEDETKSPPVCRSFQFYQWENCHLGVKMRVKQTERRNLLDRDFR